MQFVKSIGSICSVDSLSLTIPTSFIVQTKEEVMRVAQAEWDLSTGQVIEESKKLKTSRQFDTPVFTLSIRYTPNRFHLDERGIRMQGPCYMIGLSSKLLLSRYREGLHEGSVGLALDTFEKITKLEFFSKEWVLNYGTVSDVDVKYDSIKDRWFYIPQSSPDSTIKSRKEYEKPLFPGQPEKFLKYKNVEEWVIKEGSDVLDETMHTPLSNFMVDHEGYFNELWKWSKNVQHAKPYIKNKHSKAIRYWHKFRRSQSSLKQPFAIWYSKLHEYSNPEKEDFKRFVDTHLSPQDWFLLMNTVRYETTLFKAKDVKIRFGDNKLTSVMLPQNDNRYFEIVGKSLIYNMDTESKRSKSIEMKRVDYSILLLKRDVESRLHSSPLWKDGVNTSSLISSTCREVRREHTLLFERDLGRDLTEQEKATLRTKFKFIKETLVDERNNQLRFDSLFEELFGKEDADRLSGPPF